jgi:hypothetical protein
MIQRFKFGISWRGTARPLGIFVATLCPVAVLLGLLICSIGLGARVPLHVAAADAGIYVLGFLVTACIGHVVTTWFLPAARSKLLTGCAWSFPFICGIAVSIATTLVEPTTDVLGGFFGHRYENALAAGGVIFWSAIATAVVLGVDWLFCRLRDGRSSTFAIRWPRPQFRLWFLFVLTAVIAYGCLWMTTYRHRANNYGENLDEWRRRADESNRKRVEEYELQSRWIDAQQAKQRAQEANQPTGEIDAESKR